MGDTLPLATTTMEKLNLDRTDTTVHDPYLSVSKQTNAYLNKDGSPYVSKNALQNLSPN